MAASRQARATRSAVKRRARPARKAARGKARPKVQERYPRVASASYEEVLLRGITSGNGSNKTTEYSLLFNSVMSCITPGMRDLYYKSGMSAGRELYRIHHQEKRYVWYEESIADLVSFLEKAGFKGITYNIFPDKVELKFHNMSRDYLGADLHVFESGLISGFLTTGMQQHVLINEVSCSSNGADVCHFMSSSVPIYSQVDGRYAMERLIDGIRSQLESMSGTESPFSEEYHVLRSSVLLEREYSKEINDIIYHFGGMVAASLDFGRAGPRLSANMIKEIFTLLGLCKLEIESVKPLDLEMRFDVLKAKKEFVDISITFLSGLLSQNVKRQHGIEMISSKRDDSYIVRIKEKALR